VQVQVIAVGIRYFDLSYESHQVTLAEPTDITLEIYQAACKAFHELWSGLPIRHLGVHTSKVVENQGYRQLSLFDENSVDYEKQKRMDKAIDEIRSRFGTDSVMRATFLKDERIDHVSGGISREKRTVDYSKEKIE
jgi:DNA polymerase-4